MFEELPEQKMMDFNKKKKYVKTPSITKSVVFRGWFFKEFPEQKHGF